MSIDAVHNEIIFVRTVDRLSTPVSSLCTVAGVCVNSLDSGVVDLICPLTTENDGFGP